MNNRKAEERYEKLEDSHSLPQNIFARANARYVRLGVNEPIENIRQDRLNINLDTGLDHLAFSYLSIGCCFAENQKMDKAIDPLEKGARCLEYNHFSKQNRNEYSLYFVLISALAYYASNQYSKAFILLKKVELETETGKLASYFLKKDYKKLIILINRILLNPEFIPTIPDQQENIDAKIQTTIFAKALSNLLEYLYSGDQKLLQVAIEIFNDLVELLAIENEPSMWWVVRLFRIIANGFYESSLWSTIPPKILSEIPENLPENELDKIAKEIFFPFFVSPSPPERVDQFIHSLVFRAKNPVVELFVSQREALSKILDQSGAVVNLPTSSGKTRIAEIAILQCLLQNTVSKILYLAPFRSLAFEIEGTLSQTFKPLGFEISHLYGGSQFSKIDETMITESRILIATPEKAKAILRANSVITSQITLVIIDEGHLLDDSKRFVINELFIEELKRYIRRNNGKIILLSAVLPNTEEISQWITQDKNQIVISEWRPSLQRLGILAFTGHNVNLEWPEQPDQIASFNNNFIEPFILDPQTSFHFFSQDSQKRFPSNKRQAVALTAVKLSLIGSVLIFVGKAKSVIKYADEVLTAFRSASHYDWKNHDDWIAFELACDESDENSTILKFARHGILCHSADLPKEVRFSMERLMRNGKPKTIISTSTLAQGVNLGVSSVIIANTWINKNPIPAKDFWNIAGRAGRAFVDTEGKILFVSDRYVKHNKMFKPTKKFKTYQEYLTHRNWQIKRDNELAEDYFNRSNLKNVNSGLLDKIIQIKQIAEFCRIDFEHLLELISENNLSPFVTNQGENKIQDFFDWIDDTLLALDVEFENYDLETSDWIDDHFRQSLAYIQAKNKANFTQENVTAFLKARNKVVKAISGEPNKWKSFVASGLPLRSILKIDEVIEEILQIVSCYQNSIKTVEDTIEFLKATETIILQLPSSNFKFTYPQEDIDLVRTTWISGEPLNKIRKISNKYHDICNDYFGFTIPWALNGIARKLASIEKTEEATIFEELAVLSEIGLPNFFAVKIYLAGIKSRTSATELRALVAPQHFQENLTTLAESIIQNAESLKLQCSPTTAKWIDVLVKQRPVHFLTLS